MVKSADDIVYMKLYSRFQKLKDSVLKDDNTNSKGTTFIKTYNKLSDFENEYSVLTIETKENGKPYASFIIEEKIQLVSVDSKLKLEALQDRSLLAISLCRGADETTFWLIHRLHKINVPSKAAIDIDNLINDLDNLLKAP